MSKSKQTNNKKSSKYVTVNGIQLLPNGTYRVRKSIVGRKFSAHFTKRKDAISYRNNIINLMF